MGRPRFLFTARVIPPTGETDAAAERVARVAWRLVGGNNHELGRSAGTFADLDEVVAAVDEFRSRLDEVEVHPRSTDGAHMCSWRLVLDGEPVAEAARWYRRLREAEYNLAQFRAVAPTADVAAVVREELVRREVFHPHFVLAHGNPREHDGYDFGQLDDGLDVVRELPDQHVADDQELGPADESGGATGAAAAS